MAYIIKKNSYYLNDDRFYYNMVLSKGKGQLTKESQDMLILLATQTFRKKYWNYKDTDIRDDCFQTGLLHLFQNWKSFNPQKYDTCMPYFTEIFKRGLADGMNMHLGRKQFNKDIKIRMISIDSVNEGKGIYNI